MKIQNKIRMLAKAMDEAGLEEINVDDRVLFGLVRRTMRLSKPSACTQQVVQAPVMMSAAPAAMTAAGDAAAPVLAAGTVVRSPMVGVVYFSPEPGAKPFVEVGKGVKAGETLCVIEAMKTFSPVKAERDGVVAEIVAKDGQVVEFDSPLLVIS